MKRIPLFRPGTHTDSGGHTLEFSEEALKAAVAAYNPEIHEAPLVVGHPRHNAPAFGWVGAMDFQDGTVGAVPRQVNADFAEMVRSGAFKKVSASWYVPDAPSNPVPGVWYLRHVGFLGAAPPAIKGLPPLEFGDNDEGTISVEADAVDFAALESWDVLNLAGLFRRLREFLIDKFDRDTADQVVPSYAVEDLESAARRPEPEPLPEAAPAVPAFSEPNQGGQTVADNTPAPASATPTAPAAPAPAPTAQPDRTAEFAERDRDLREREARILAKEQEMACKEIASFVDGLVNEGKVLPAHRVGLVEFMTRLDTAQVVEFEEEGKQIKTPASDWLRGFLKDRPAVVEYGERAGNDDGAGGGHFQNFDDTTRDIAKRAVDFQEAERKAGREVTMAQAVQHVTRQARSA